MTMRAVVIYESLTGNTERAALMIGNALVSQGAEVSVFPITAVGLTELAQADLVVIGTWVDGLILVGHRPGRAGRVRRLPVIDHKRAAVFCTYAVNPGNAVDKLAALVAERGAHVVARRAIRRNDIPTGVAALVADVMGTAQV